MPQKTARFPIHLRPNSSVWVKPGDAFLGAEGLGFCCFSSFEKKLIERLSLSLKLVTLAARTVIIKTAATDTRSQYADDYVCHLI